MTTQINQDADSVTLTRHIKAPRRTVFAAWTQPAALRQWFCYDATLTVETHELKVGGTFQYRFNFEDGRQNRLAGTFLEVQAPQRLAFTWQWERFDDKPNEAVTQVVVDFAEEGEHTLLRVHHSGFASEERTAQHDQGWNRVLSNLEDFLQNKS